MKINHIMKKIKSYFKELTIVTIGVLIALVISNFKENNQARKYHIASTEAVKDEINLNYAALKVAIERHTNLQDTIYKYSKEHVLLRDLILKADGLHGAFLRNTGLDFYKRNEINSIDYEMMIMLMDMESNSKLIDTKLEKLMDFMYPNLFVDSEESKMLVVLYLGNLLNSEMQLMHSYELFIDKYINTTSSGT